MNNINMIMQCCIQRLDGKPLRHLCLIVEALLSMSGRVTMLGISRWTEKGASYRTVQRFFAQKLNWPELNGYLFKQFIFSEEDVLLVAGDTTTVSKSGQQTYGLGRYFHSIYNRAVPGLCFVNLSLISVKHRRAFPIIVEQYVKAEPKPEEPPKPKQAKAGRPKGSKNKNRSVVLSPQIKWIQGHLKQLQGLIGDVCKPMYFLYDNALGNAEGVAMVESLGIELISKLKCHSALWFPYEQKGKRRGRPRIYGDKVDYQALPDKYLKSSVTDNGVLTDTYQMTVRHKSFAKPLNVVIIRKTYQNKVGQVILFSTDLDLDHTLLVDYYRLRFQIEFTFREAKQHWGLEDFMNVSQQQVHNAANLALFMVNMTFVLRLQKEYQNMGSS